MGVDGDDSWSPSVNEDFLLTAGRYRYRYRYRVRLKRASMG
ncbi:hypothetical protein L580_0922 [Serratia fonticola AU-P3(3)]|nr:hypothetical protein L580_0922 [Serratia fonticola AU-P3(3)]